MEAAMIAYNNKTFNCPMEVTMDLIGGKWKVLILWHLSSGMLRFNELKRRFPDVTQKMLTQQLRDLEADGLVLRKVYPQVPPKVEYSLTETGSSIVPVLKQMNEWGADFVKNNCESI
jgi:DNA-binding HxlR family transcriptional regulator